MSSQKTKKLFAFASGFFIALGSGFGKLLSLIPATLLFKVIPQGLIVIGNIGWIHSNTYSKSAEKKQGAWYGFAQFNTQQAIAAVLGILAALATILSFSIPVFLPVSFWIAALGNVMWTISELHHTNNKNPDDTSNDMEKQPMYWRYTVAMAALAIISAINTTLSFLFPPATLVANVITGLVNTILAVVGGWNYFKYYFTPSSKTQPPPKTTEPHSSSATVLQGLGFPNEIKLDNTCEPPPPKMTGIFQDYTGKLGPDTVNSLAPETP